MAFKSYLITELPNDTWRLTHPEPIRLSGRQGLVARHLCALNPAETARWSLADTDWLRFVAAEPADSRWIVFEQCEEDHLCLSRVLRINGLVSGGQTELLLTLSPLEVVTTVPGLIVSVPARGRAWSEELALDGAPDRPSAPWSWCERALHVGAAVLGRSAT